MTCMSNAECTNINRCRVRSGLAIGNRGACRPLKVDTIDMIIKPDYFTALSLKRGLLLDIRSRFKQVIMPSQNKIRSFNVHLNHITRGEPPSYTVKGSRPFGISNRLGNANAINPGLSITTFCSPYIRPRDSLRMSIAPPAQLHCRFPPSVQPLSDWPSCHRQLRSSH